MKVRERSKRKASLHLRQSHKTAGESPARKARQGGASPPPSSCPRNQKQWDLFSSEAPSSLVQFAFPRKEPTVVWTGSRRLLLGVLQDALRSFFHYRSSRSRSGKRIFNETWSWLLSSEPHWLFSFENVCAHLNLDPDYLRKGLQRFLQETEPSLTRTGTGMFSPLAKPPRRPFRLIAGPGSRLPSRFQDSPLRGEAGRPKAEKRLR